MNGSSDVKIPLRPSALLNIKNDDKYCFIWSLLAHLQPWKYSNPNSVSNYKQYLDEFNIDAFNFTNGFKFSDVQKFGKLNNLSIYIFELCFYQDKKKWKHKLTHIEIFKYE